MFCSILSSAVCGIICKPVKIELDMSGGMPVFTMIGSLSANVRESQDRVRTALKNMDIFLPPKRITVSISPGDIRKDGTRFDLPVAAALLVALGKISEESVHNCMIMGELHLNGDTEGVAGILPSVIAAKELGVTSCIVPYKNAAEAANVDGVKIIAVRNLAEFIEYCASESKDDYLYKKEDTSDDVGFYPDFADIRGQSAVKRAALIAAAGFHNILMCGPPGSGKSMAAKRIPSILPPLTPSEQLEVSKIYSVSGLLSEKNPIMTRRPFRAPHFSLSAQALLGGGAIPKPGEITLAHRGVLFIDELPEMPGRVLEQLRSPLEDRCVTISRTLGSYTFPSHFLFAAAMNPCPCGYYPDMNKCTCSAPDIKRYVARLSRPILDRIDIRVNVPQPSYDVLKSPKSDSINSDSMRNVVSNAFDVQKERYSKLDICFNSELSPPDIKKFCTLTDEAERILEALFTKLDLSARAYHRILRLSRTIADIEQSDIISEAHISEAFAFRNSIQSEEKCENTAI